MGNTRRQRRRLRIRQERLSRNGVSGITRHEIVRIVLRLRTGHMESTFHSLDRAMPELAIEL